MMSLKRITVGLLLSLAVPTLAQVVIVDSTVQMSLDDFKKQYCAGVTPAPTPTPTPTPTPVVPLMQDSFSYPDGLITNEYAYWNPTLPGIFTNPLWEMTSGSLFATGGWAWTGIPDTVNPNIGSTNGNDSAVFRLNTKAKSFGDIAVSAKLMPLYFTTTATTPAQPWDGVEIWLRYQTQYNLYALNYMRRDNKIVFKKKCAGGPSNNGTYFFSPYTASPVVFNAIKNAKVTAKTQADGSVRLEMWGDGVLLASVVDDGKTMAPDPSLAGAVQCAPITAPGAVGVRADNINLKFDDFTVNAL